METKSKRRDLRIEKAIPAVIDGESGVLENISQKGGFLKIKKTLPKNRFKLLIG